MTPKDSPKHYEIEELIRSFRIVQHHGFDVSFTDAMGDLYTITKNDLTPPKYARWHDPEETQIQITPDESC